MKRVVVIGAGASGMCAAICAAKNGAKVMVLEKGKVPLKKLSMTGNGRCNLSNTDMRADCYNAEAARYHRLFSPEGVETVISFFRELGVLIRSEEGYLYPVSGQATSVANALLTKARLLGVEVVCGVQGKEILRVQELRQDPLRPLRGHRLRSTPVRAIPTSPGRRAPQRERQVGSWEVESGMQEDSESVRWEVRGVKIGETVTYRADAVIIAAGALSGPKSTLSTGDGYYIAKQLGLRVTECTPALVKVKTSDSGLPKERGVRMWGNIRFLTEEERVIAEEYGEIQITENALSGIPVLQASAAVAKALREGAKIHAVIDFFAQIDRRRQVRVTEEDASKEAARKKMTETLYDDFVGHYMAQLAEEDGDRVSVGEALNGICNAYINEMILKREGLTPDTALSKVSGETLRRTLLSYRALSIDIDDVGDYADAQATAGGVMTDDLDDTLQATCAPGIYLAGELLDVDGRCGGYNLHWAFLSGMIAGEAAAGKGV